MYRAALPGALRVVALDDLTAIYHRASGLTHLVASPVPELLAALAEPANVDALLVQLGAAFDLADADRAALTARLEELVATGLVERL